MHPSLVYAYSRPISNPWITVPPYEEWKKIYDEIEKRNEQIAKETSREVRHARLKLHGVDSVRAASKEMSLRIACWKAQENNPFTRNTQTL